MKIFLFISCLYFLISAADAKLTYDSSLEVATRSYPLAGSVSIEGGMGTYLWDKREEAPFKFGHTRLGGKFQSAGQVNLIEGNFSVYPISLLGVELFSSWGSRNLSKIDTLDCEKDNCKGQVQRHTMVVPLTLGFRNYFTRISWENQWIYAKDQEKLFADEFNNVIYRPDGDRHTRVQVLIGRKFGDDLRLFLVRNQLSTNQLRQWRRSHLLIGSKSFKNNHSVTLGAGVFETINDKSGLQVIAIYRYHFALPIGL